MVEILTSLHGRKIGLSRHSRLVVNTDSGVNGVAEMLIGAPTAASTAVSNTTTETMFDNFITIPANTLAAGQLLRVRYQGIATSTNSTDTLAIKLYLATATTAGAITGTTLISHAATDVANNDVFQGEYEMLFRTVGSSGTVVGCGTYKSVPAAEGTMTTKDDILASTAVDTTAALYLGVSATWSVASTSNSCRLDFLRALAA